MFKNTPVVSQERNKIKMPPTKPSMKAPPPVKKLKKPRMFPVNMKGMGKLLGD